MVVERRNPDPRIMNKNWNGEIYVNDIDRSITFRSELLHA